MAFLGTLGHTLRARGKLHTNPSGQQIGVLGAADANRPEGMRLSRDGRAVALSRAVKHCIYAREIFRPALRSLRLLLPITRLIF